MHKVVKEFNNEDLAYLLGYEIWDNKVYPCIDIYINEKLFFGGHLSYEDNNTFFYFLNINFDGYVDNIKEMFINLRKKINIPEYIEEEFEKIVLLYKLNDFKKL